MNASWESVAFNMAALRRLLSFTNAKLLVSTMRLASVPAQHLSVKAHSTGEPIGHTGQVFEDNDPRRARFVGRRKEVNKNFAIDMVYEEPVSDVAARVVSCDGGGGALGHPKVYINLDKDTKVGTCGYCGLQFKQTHHH
ncbi:NADH dehydrogenase [ubiquinone] iron-sulfur protein 6, mitochondrial [Gouania willdenowi]|uniref:NADH dehydrogenase [ubiquinone] iron-sulfur protein 6, mitochondrial n=1 Tax=Gouania willdenowi TaxID=441366 RepID=A0A8C5EQ76_GOUWI|nr:NADH dehydrogenase [ubiquinone] iron-sulfur protein 6, mitochondrial [Gouania willdenowi]